MLVTSNFLLLFLHLLDLDLHLLTFAVTDLLILDSVLVSLGDLVDNDLSSLFTCSKSVSISLLLDLERLKALNLHHEVKFLLLLDVFSLEDLRLLQLLVSNSNHLGVKHYLIHLFDIIQLLIK